MPKWYLLANKSEGNKNDALFLGIYQMINDPEESRQFTYAFVC